MCHCSPAPPNCPENMVYNAMCLPGGEMAALGVGLLVTAILISIIYVRNE